MRTLSHLMQMFLEMGKVQDSNSQGLNLGTPALNFSFAPFLSSVILPQLA